MQTIDTQTGEVTERSIKAVAHKITLAMADMDAYASKDGTNTFHKYDYTSIAQYMAHVRPALVKHGLVIVPSLISHIDYEDSTTDVLMEYTIIDSDSGEYLKQRIIGRGQDVSRDGKRLDKGPYKAYSGAFKYFLAETFMIASGDDPDDSGPKPVASKAGAVVAKPTPKPIPPKAEGNGHKEIDPMTRYWQEVKAAGMERQKGLDILAKCDNNPSRAVDVLLGIAQDATQPA